MHLGPWAPRCCRDTATGYHHDNCTAGVPLPPPPPLTRMGLWTGTDHCIQPGGVCGVCVCVAPRLYTMSQSKTPWTVTLYTAGVPRVCVHGPLDWDSSLDAAWMFPACVVLWTGTHHSMKPGCPPLVCMVLWTGTHHCIQPGCPALVWSFGLGHTIVYSRGVLPLCDPLHWDTSLYTTGVSRPFVVLYTGTHHCIQQWCLALVWSFALGHIIVYSRGVPPLCGPLHWDIVYSRSAPRFCCLLDLTTLLYTAGVCGLWVGTHHCIQPGCGLLDWDTSLCTAGCVVLWTGTHCVQPGCVILWTGTHCIQPGVWSFGFGHIIVYSRCVWCFGLGHSIVYSRGLWPFGLGHIIVYSRLARRLCGLWTGTPSGYSHTWAMPQNNASR